MVIFIFFLALFTRRALHKTAKIVVSGKTAHESIARGVGAIRDVLIDGTQMEYLTVARELILNREIASGHAFWLFFSLRPRSIRYGWFSVDWPLLVLQR